mmetsp:Transcript_10195/g.20906  ORF Transcript_10195/g.20906 Transcript_10195/m.20906 type:complete len:101 (-) Transcript_10195:230-532(-)
MRFRQGRKCRVEGTGVAIGKLEIPDQRANTPLLSTTAAVRKRGGAPLIAVSTNQLAISDLDKLERHSVDSSLFTNGVVSFAARGRIMGGEFLLSENDPLR